MEPLYAELEIGLHRVQAESYQIELRFTDPGDADVTILYRGLISIDSYALLALSLDFEGYGRALTGQLFADLQAMYFIRRAKVAAETAGHWLRLRLLIGSSAPELHALRWELLADPDTGVPFACSARTVFSRFVPSQDWRAVRLRPKAALRALVAVAAPVNFAEYGLAPIDSVGEVHRAREALAGIAVEVVGLEEPLTIEHLDRCLRRGVDICYLVSHSTYSPLHELVLFLQGADGQVTVVRGDDLAQRIGDLREPPLLMVLACNESASWDMATAAGNSLAHSLASAGVGAVLGMQGQITLATVARLMPCFFSEILRDGRVDRALSVARGLVRESVDAWVPVLYMQLRGGRIWCESAVAHPDGRDEVRRLLLDQRYAEAIEVLHKIRSLDESSPTDIELEFGFLSQLGADTAGGARRDALDWCTRLWCIAAAGNASVLPTLETGSESLEGTADEAAAYLQDLGGLVATQPGLAQEQNIFDPETAFTRLLELFFALDSGQEDALRVKLHQAQSVIDPALTFAVDAVRKEMPGIRCHLEFINRSEPFTSRELAGRWLEAAVREPRPDHWVLISPRADPDAELQRFLEAGRARSLYGFQVLIWGPASGVREFFGLEPSLFEQFFPGPATGQHPRDWGSEQRARVLDRFNGLLQTMPSLPEGWDRYVEHPEYLCFTENEQMEFAAAYPGRVRLKLLSRDGTTELPKTAEESLIEDWLDAPNSPRCCFLLGDFGDGKSFLTYTLARELLQRFRHSPRTGTVPLRLALREFDYHRTTPRDFLQARVERFGAEIRGWETIKREFRPPLAILDGFDEISKELDPRTVSENIDALLKCWEASVFDGCKILITSRMHFFESRDAQRLLSRLENPLVYRLARIPRHQVRQHLSQGVKGDAQRALLRRIETMHDPIGLASKPLFYQMVRSTLDDLPQDPDEATIYESYVQRALRRKWELLDDPDLSTDRDRILEGIWAVLGRLAEELQSATQPYVSLRALAERPGMDLARVLWSLSAPEAERPAPEPADLEGGLAIRCELQRRLGELREDLKNITDDLNRAGSAVERGRLDRERKQIEEQLRQVDADLAGCDLCSPGASAAPSPLEQDALARVGARSLLTRVEADDASGEWLVDFCHRSVREFFVARQLLDALKAGPEAAVAFFERVPLSWEILFFAGRLLRRGDPAQWIDRLLAVLERSRIETDTRGFGGSVLTLLAGLSPRLPDGFDYRGRSYELADLQGADLSERDFSGSRFRRANLANANLTGANLSRCDLTGVRLDETAGVRALAASAPGERVLAAYEDGSVWEWNLTPGERQDYGIVFAEQGLRISRFGRAPAGVAWALAERRLLLFDVGTDGWVCMARIPLEQASNDLMVQGSAVALLGSDGGSRCRVVDLDGMAIGLEAPMPETPVFAAAGKEVLVHRMDDKRLRLAARGAHATLGCEIPCLEATCVSLLVPDDGEALVAWGQANGQVRLARVRTGAAGPQIDEVFASPVHAGSVTSLVFLSEDALVSGGVDRKIVISRIMASGSSPAPVPPLVRNLACKGLRVDGLVPEDRRQRLAALIAQAETGPGLT